MPRRPKGTSLTCVFSWRNGITFPVSERQKTKLWSGSGYVNFSRRPITIFASVAIFTFFPFRTARIVLRSSPVSLVVLRNPRALISAIRGFVGSHATAVVVNAIVVDVLDEIAKQVRLNPHDPVAHARRTNTQRRQAAALRAWTPSDRPNWLDRKFYAEKIQPRLLGIRVPRIMTALSVSEPYARRIRSGHCIPHQRLWLTLTSLARVQPDE